MRKYFFKPGIIVYNPSNFRLSRGFMKIRGLILDMDGVLWRGEQPIGNLHKAFDKINDLSIKVVLATNNSTRSPDQYLQKLLDFGVILENWQILISSQVAAHYLKRIFPDGGPVYIIGEVGLIEALNKEGFYNSEERALAVVSGMDRQFNYEKLTIATLLIRSGSLFIATNPDRTFPTPIGLVPGAGSILSAIEAATDTHPRIVGKPEPEMYTLALKRLGTSIKETLVVGDRLETDIKGAQILGCPTCLVLSGVTTMEESKMWVPNPDWVTPDLMSLLVKLDE